ncbi:hypothetical protein ABE504_20515 [Paenibacillus oryzisoli]|uniref:hypothetical protein n=1 Tax=Paenibacillus oryzisoli TaxID=1850517 RepID=UPI003D2683E9
MGERLRGRVAWVFSSATTLYPTFMTVMQLVGRHLLRRQLGIGLETAQIARGQGAEVVIASRSAGCCSLFASTGPPTAWLLKVRSKWWEVPMRR